MKFEIIRQELIGKSAECKNIKGKIVDETKNTITIRNKKNEIKKVSKNNNKFMIIIDDKTIEIKGEDILKRPEERIKIKSR